MQAAPRLARPMLQRVGFPSRASSYASDGTTVAGFDARYTFFRELYFATPGRYTSQNEVYLGSNMASATNEVHGAWIVFEC